MNSSSACLHTVYIVLCFPLGQIYSSPIYHRSSVSLQPSVETLLRPLPSPLCNKPEAWKGVASSMTKLRLNIVVGQVVQLHMLDPEIPATYIKLISCEESFACVLYLLCCIWLVFHCVLVLFAANSSYGNTFLVSNLSKSVIIIVSRVKDVFLFYYTVTFSSCKKVTDD